MMADKTKNNEKKEIQKTEPQKPQVPQLVSEDGSDFQCYLDTAKFNQMWRASQVFANSEIVPTQYRGKPNDCFIALQMAMRCKCDPMAFMQGTYVVYGRPGMEAKLAIALMNSRGPFDGPVQWKFDGAGASRKCTAYATHQQTGEICQATVSWEMAEKEGWTKKSGSKWQTMPDLMFMYRSAVFLGRLYCPEVLYGMQTVEEIVDVGPTAQPTENIAAELGVNGLKKKIESQEIKSPAEPPKRGRPPKEQQPAEEPDPETQKKAEQIEKMKTAPKPKDYCPDCDEVIEQEHHGTNSKGETVCDFHGKVLIERP